MSDPAQARYLNPAGDTPRKTSDVINQHSDLLNNGQFQKRTIADLAGEDATEVAGRSFYVPDESGGPCIVVSDGTNWRVLTLGAIAS